MSNTVEFFGEPFTIADRVGAMALMRFAKAAQAGADSDEMAGLVAMYDLLEQCIAVEDWQRFQQAAHTHRADGEQLMAVVANVFEMLAERPTTRPSDSSDGPLTTEANSEAVSFSPVSHVQRDLEQKGRPDLALMVMQAQRSA